MNIVSEIKESWGWSGIDPEEVVGENDFGNLIIKDKAGKYWRLCPEDVYCEVIANNYEELNILSHDQDFANDWHMVNLVNIAKEQLGPLKAGQKYHLIIPGILGGEYDISNFRIVSIIEQIRFSGDIGKQIQELPDGANIELKVIE